MPASHTQLELRGDLDEFESVDGHPGPEVTEMTLSRPGMYRLPSYLAGDGSDVTGIIGGIHDIYATGHGEGHSTSIENLSNNSPRHAIPWGCSTSMSPWEDTENSYVPHVLPNSGFGTPIVGTHPGLGTYAHMHPVFASADKTATIDIPADIPPMFSTPACMPPTFNIPAGVPPTVSMPTTGMSPTIVGPHYRVKTKSFFVCTWPGCNKEYTRKPDVERHHRAAHQWLDPYKCRTLGCERAIRGFSRKDKRDTHEKAVHGRGRNLNGVNRLSGSLFNLSGFGPAPNAFNY